MTQLQKSTRKLTMMNPIEDAEIIEKVRRLKKIADEIENLSQLISSSLIKVSHLRKEAIIIESELEEFAKEKSEKPTRKV